MPLVLRIWFNKDRSSKAKRQSMRGMMLNPFGHVKSCKNDDTASLDSVEAIRLEPWSLVVSEQMLYRILERFGARCMTTSASMLINEETL